MTLTLPYPGLRPFQESDGPIFFGREKQIATLLRRLEKHRFVAVIGASGSGKSSLVKAGLLPAVRRGFLAGAARWLPIVIRPGADPYQRLGNELLNFRHPSVISATEDVTKTFRKALRLTDHGLIDAIAALGLDPDTRVLLVIDQFEELFTFRSAIPGFDAHASRDDAFAFVTMLLTAVKEKHANIWVLLTMRSDFIGHCEAFFGLPENVSQSQFLVPRLDAWQMEEAIVRPGLVTGQDFKPFTVTPELVNIISNEAGDRTDQLPLMQHALMRTWKNAVAVAAIDGSPILLTEINYADAGRINNALNRDAESAWQSIKNDSHLSEICRKMFMLLCDVLPSGQIVRRRPRVSEVIRVTEASPEQIAHILHVFQEDDRNFLLPQPNAGFDNDTILDITHESLFRQWRQIQHWMQRESESVANYQDLVKGARQQSAEPEYFLNRLQTQKLSLWLSAEKPTAAWADRYGGNFHRAMAFLGSCKKSVLADEYRKKRRRKYQLISILVGLVLLAAAAISVASILTHKNAELRATIQRQNAELLLQQNQSLKLEKEAEKNLRNKNATADFNALRLATRSLRSFPGNENSQNLVCQLLMEHRWCLPASPTVVNDFALDKFFLATALSADYKNLLIVTQEAMLLRWDGHRLMRTPLSDAPVNEEPAIHNEGSAVTATSDNPAVIAKHSGSQISKVLDMHDDGTSPLPKIAEAFFSDDGKYLVVTNSASSKAVPVKRNETSARLYLDDRGDGSYRLITTFKLQGSAPSAHSFAWCPAVNALVVSTIDWQKPEATQSQIFQIEGSAIKPMDMFSGLRVCSASFTADGKHLFTAVQPLGANADTKSPPSAEEPGKIQKWTVSDDNGILKFSLDDISFDIPLDYQTPLSINSSSDGKLVSVWTWGHPPIIVDTEKNTARSFYLPDGSPISRVSFCPSNRSELSDLMLVSTNDRISFWKVSQLKVSNDETYELGQPWCEPVVFQGGCVPVFANRGEVLIVLSGGSFRYFECARVFGLPVKESILKWSNRDFLIDHSVPVWLLDLAGILTGSGREQESEFDDRAKTISEIYGQQENAGAEERAIYKTLREKFRPTTPDLRALSAN